MRRCSSLGFGFSAPADQGPTDQIEGRGQQRDDQQRRDPADAEPDEKVDQTLQSADQILNRLLGHSFRMPAADLDRLAKEYRVPA